MNVTRPLTEALVRAATSPRAAKTELSADEMHAIALFGAKAHDALAWIRLAAETAIAQGGAIEPRSLIDFLTDNDLMLKELSHGQNGAEDQGNEPSRAAVA